MNRVYGVPYFAHGKTVKMGFVQDHLKKDADIRKDLSVNYGVEKVVPIAMRGGIDGVYRDIKASGSQVKESMQREKEVGEKKKKAKQKDWMKGAMKRSPVRTREMLDRKAEKAAKDRSISL
jgi:hypothetical protein